jgi:hypothetical protein
MRQFFRLLFISFGLLLLLGLNGGQSFQTGIELTDSSTLLQKENLHGIVPNENSEAFHTVLITDWSLLREGCLLLRKHKEFVLATRIRTRLIFFRESYLKYSPGIIIKKGIHIFLPAQKVDLPLA